MTDLSRLIAELCAGLGADEPGPLSISVETLSTRKNPHSFGKADNFHDFQPFHSQNEGGAFCDDTVPENRGFSRPESRASSSYVGGVETAESVERDAKTLARIIRSELVSVA